MIKEAELAGFFVGLYFTSTIMSFLLSVFLLSLILTPVFHPLFYQLLYEEKLYIFIFCVMAYVNYEIK